MSVIDTLIFDRTQSDTARAAYLNGLWDPKTGGWKGTDAELAEWLESPKGTYNTTDLNRVGAAVEYVAGRFHAYGYAVQVNPKKDWSEADNPTQAQMAQYLADVAELRGVLAVLPTTPQVPEQIWASKPRAEDGLTIEKANDIEKILTDVETVINIMVTTFIPCGEAICGKDNL